MRVLVTGGAGFIGSHVVDALLQRGEEVLVLDNLDPDVHQGKKPAWLHPNAKYFFYDLEDISTLTHSLQGIDSVIHLAALMGIGRSMVQVTRYIRGNSLATAKLLEFLIRLGNRPRKRFVVASSMSVYGEGFYHCNRHGFLWPPVRNPMQIERRQWEFTCSVCFSVLTPVATPEDKPLQPTSVYAISKRDQEELCLTIGQAYGIPTVVLRFFNVYGPRQSLSNPHIGVGAVFSGLLTQGRAPVLFEDGQQTRDFIHVSDVVQAILIALDHPNAAGQALNVGTGRATSVRHFSETLATAFHLEEPPIPSGQARAGDVRHCFADISRLTSLGFQPKVGLQEGLHDLARWLSCRHPQPRESAPVSLLHGHDKETAAL